MSKPWKNICDSYLKQRAKLPNIWVFRDKREGKKTAERWAKWRTSPAGERLVFCHDMHEAPHGRCKRSLLCTNPDFLPRQPIQFVLSAPHQRPPRSPQWKDTLDNTSLGLALASSSPSQAQNPIRSPSQPSRPGCYQGPWVNALLHKPSHNQPSFVWLQDIAGDFWWLGSGNMTDSKQSVKYRLVAIVLAALETLLVWKGQGLWGWWTEDGPLGWCP